MKIPFYKPVTSTLSSENVNYLEKHKDVLTQGYFTKKCISYFEEQYKGYKALMTPSCTRAMDIIALALDLKSDDEVIMPSYNYVGIANAFANVGANIVFADLHTETMNVSFKSIKSAFTAKTKAVVLMHYNGVGQEIIEIKEFCEQNQLVLIEDNAQGISTKYEGKLLGSYGDFSCISFDRLKNVSCGEGGVILFKEEYTDVVNSIFHNGTNKPAFNRGEVAAYEWVRQGSKFEFSEYAAAILYPLLINSEQINIERKEKWDLLYKELYEIEALRFALPDPTIENNGHIFFLKLNSIQQRNDVAKFLANQGVRAYFHYMPLHSSPMSQVKKYRMKTDNHTTVEANKLLRLPVYNDLTLNEVKFIAEILEAYISK